MSKFSDAMKMLRESEAYIAREKRRAAARKNMAALVAAQWKLRDLQELFGRALFGKLREAPSRHQIPGKHHRMRHDQCLFHHPAGTKLVRRFIRRGSSENTAMRKLYTQLTGHQYGELKAKEAE